MRIQKKQLPTRPFDRVVKTTCPLCGAGCGLKVFIKDGRAVEIYGDEENQLNKGSLCPRGLMALSHLYQDKRLLAPLLREKLSDPFREATWDEALDFVATRLKQVKEKHGPEKMGGWCSARTTNEENYLMQKLMRAALGSNHVDHCARL